MGSELQAELEDADVSSTRCPPTQLHAHIFTSHGSRPRLPRVVACKQLQEMSPKTEPGRTKGSVVQHRAALARHEVYVTAPLQQQVHNLPAAASSRSMQHTGPRVVDHADIIAGLHR